MQVQILSPVGVKQVKEMNEMLLVIVGMLEQLSESVCAGDIVGKCVCMLRCLTASHIKLLRSLEVPERMQCICCVMTKEQMDCVKAEFGPPQCCMLFQCIVCGRCTAGRA